MGKKIILLSDGTGNSAAKVWRTNVWRVFEALDLRGSDQVAFYDDGVGTSAFKPLAILGGAFGWGLKRNVLDLYKFLCRNYQSSDDEIFAFGFSRGAFTIRVLIGLVVDQGLVKYQTEEELNRKIKAAYRAYRAENFHSKTKIESVGRWLRNLFVKASHDKNEKPVERIRFLGLWDTVAAYGSPIEEMTRGISRYLWPLELPDRTLHEKVKRACHALSLDDERTTFHPVLWDESREAPASSATGVRRTKDERISQVWFAGVHSNVGGGYPDDSLAYVSLNWIISEAQACGLRFKAAPDSDPDALVHARSAQDKDGRLYDSRSGVGGYYRYGPRKISDLCNTHLSKDPRDQVKIAIAKIHESALDRTKMRAHLYAPIVLPEKYEVVTSDGRVLASGEQTYETPERAEARSKAQESVWNFVWQRRAIYFLTVFASIYLASYPLYHKTYATAEFETPLRHVSDTIRLIGSFLPGAARPWLDGYARDPGWFLLIIGLVAALIAVGSWLGTRISDRMSAIWHVALSPQGARVQIETGNQSAVRRTVLFIFWAAVIYIVFYPLLPRILQFETYSPFETLNSWFNYYSGFPVRGILACYLVIFLLPQTVIYKLRTHPLYQSALRALKLRIAPAFFALLFVYLAFMFGNHLAFSLEDAFGLICKESEKPDELRFCSAPTIAMCDQRGQPVCQNKRLKPQCQGGSPVCGADNVAMCGNVPAVCPKPCTDDVATITRKFDTKDVCFSTGVKLEQWGTYRLTVTPDQDRWRALYGTIGTSAGGFRVAELTDPVKKAVMLFLWPLKRSFIRPWFSFVARFGSEGNEEDFIDPDPDPTSQPKKVILEEKFKPTRDGELFLYVNDAVLAWPWNFFSRWNQGTATITIERIPN